MLSRTPSHNETRMTDTMNLDQIRQELSQAVGRFPSAAVRAAVAQREAVTPMLLDVLREVVAHPELAPDGPNDVLHIFAMYLLAQFREQAAYPLLVRLFSNPGEIAFDVAGDVVTEDLAGIMASVCGDDLAPLQGLIENPTANPYVRGACMRSLGILAAHGLAPREAVIAYFRGLFERGIEGSDDPALVWAELVSTVVDIQATELAEAIDQAYARGLVDEEYITPQDVARLFALDREQALAKFRRDNAPVDDTEALLSRWFCFRPDANISELQGLDPEAMARYAAAETMSLGSLREPLVKGPKVGRNDPCPCGSGKKYKKCCLDADRSAG